MAKKEALFVIIATAVFLLGTMAIHSRAGETPTPPVGQVDSEPSQIQAGETPTPPVGQVDSEPSQIIFSWAGKLGGVAQNWPEFVVYYVLGMIGALVTVYLFLGEFLPSTGGKVEYMLLKKELEDCKTRRAYTLSIREKLAGREGQLPIESLDGSGELSINDTIERRAKDLTEDYDKIIERLERQLPKERWKLFLVGFPMFILLGGFFASALATNLLQAVLIGFSWTAVANHMGLQREQAIRKESKDEAIGKLEKEASDFARKANAFNIEMIKAHKKIELQEQLIQELGRVAQKTTP